MAKTLVFGGLLVAAALLLLAGLAPMQMVISNHAQGGHLDEAYNSEEIYAILQSSVAMNGGGPCKKLEIYSCMLAKNEKGQPSPHFKAACQMNENSWVMGLIGVRSGMDNPVYITGYVVTRDRIRSLVQRDKCIGGNFTILQKLFNTPLRYQN